MCRLLPLVLGVIGLIGTPDASKAADAETRFGIALDPKTYPQDKPKELLASVIKAIEAKRTDYILAHLADPEWVDKRVKDNGGKTDELMKESKAKLLDDPSTVKQFHRFLKEGEWDVDEATAKVVLKDLPDRSIGFRKIGDRWFMENRYKPKKTTDND